MTTKAQRRICLSGKNPIPARSLRPVGAALVLAGTLVSVVLAAQSVQAQTVTTFEGIDASQYVLHERPQHDVDPNGAVGTKQFMEWTNVVFQAYDKVSGQPVWSAGPVQGTLPWKSNKITGCDIAGDGVILFDRLASRWVVGGHNSPPKGNTFSYCIAVSNTDDLASPALAWYAYEFPLNIGVNGENNPFFPDWPKLGTWADAYYLSFDAIDVDQKRIVGAGFCAMDRTSMLTGSKNPNPIQCLTDPPQLPAHGSFYPKHSPIPADVEGLTPPPSGQDLFYVSIQAPPSGRTTSNTINLWDFHLNWSGGSTLTNSPLTVPNYTPGCYEPSKPTVATCVPQPATRPTGGHYVVDSVGDRLMPRLAYRNFGSYQSYLVSHTVRVGTGASKQTGIRWYELRGSGTPTLYQSGTISRSDSIFRFLPSVAQDHVGNAAVGYSASSPKIHPGIRASSWSLTKNGKAAEVVIQNGGGDQEDSLRWGDYTSMTVNPVDDCTFWFVDEYFAANEIGPPINWHTRIGSFALPSCTGGKARRP